MDGAEPSSGQEETAPADSSAEPSGELSELPARPPRRTHRRVRIPGVLNRPPMRGPRTERHHHARRATAAAGGLPGPAGLTQTELAAVYDHLDEHLRALPGPDEVTDTAVAAFCTWLSTCEPATWAAVAAVRAEREEVAAAALLLTRMRAGQEIIGAAHANRIRDLAALAPIYRRARRGPTPIPDSDSDNDNEGEGVGEGVGAAFQRHADAVAAAGLEDLVAELAPALGWTAWSTQAQVLLAARVVAVMPYALARLERGQLPITALTATANRLAEVDDLTVAGIDEELFGAGGLGVGLTATSLRHEVDHQIGLRDPAALDRRARRKVSARRVSFTACGDGQATLSLHGPVTALAPLARTLRAVGAANQAAAGQAAREGRPAPDGGDPYAEPGQSGESGQRDQRSAAAHVFDAGVTALALARPAAVDATSAVWALSSPLEVRISLPSLLGVEDDPAYVVGYGWVAPFLVRAGLRSPGCRLRRVLSDPFTGDLIAVDGHTYPASWLTTPDDDGPDDGPASGPGPGPGDGPQDDGDPDTPAGGAGSTAPTATPPATSPSGSPGSSPAQPSPRSATGAAARGRAGRFRGHPIQQLPPKAAATFETAPGWDSGPASDPAAADPAADPAADRGDRRDDSRDADPDVGWGDGWDHGPEPDADVDLDLDLEVADACAAGECEPVDADACPLSAIGGGPHDPPAALRRYVTALWGTSTGPGDTLPAEQADLDHVTPWGPGPGQGGPTCACNLDPKSRSTHRRKHAATAPDAPWSARWEHWRCTAGHAHWRSPLGIEHVTRPKPYTDPDPMYRAWAPPPRVTAPDTFQQAKPALTFPEEPSF